jgi:hypothetical protein
MCVTLQSNSLVPRHYAADAQLIIHSVGPSVLASSSYLKHYEVKAKVLFFFDVPQFPKELFFVGRSPDFTRFSR